MIGEPGTDNRPAATSRARQALRSAGRVVGAAARRGRGVSIGTWISAIFLAFFVWSWLFPRPPAAPRVDLAVESISFDSVDTWDWTTAGCTAGPRVRVRARVKNHGTVPMEDAEARVRFVGRPAAGMDAETLTFEVPIRSIGTSRRTDEVTDGATVTLPAAFLTRQSYWTATVVHPEDASSQNDTVSGAVLNPCGGRPSRRVCAARWPVRSRGDIREDGRAVRSDTGHGRGQRSASDREDDDGDPRIPGSTEDTGADRARAPTPG